MRSQGGQCKAWRICWPSKVAISTAIDSHKMTKTEKTHGLMVGLHVLRWVGLKRTPRLYNGPHEQDHILRPHTSFNLTPTNLLPSSRPMDDGALRLLSLDLLLIIPKSYLYNRSVVFFFVLKPTRWSKGKRLDPLCAGHMTNSRGCNSRCDQDNRPQATRTRLGHWQFI